MEGPDQLIRRISDELEIRNLIARLAQCADRGDLEECGSLYTEDANWELRGQQGGPTIAPRRGRDDIITGSRERRASGAQGPGTHTRHIVATTAVSVNGDTATATSYLTFYKNTHKRPEIVMMTFYSDEFKRTPEGWKLSKRIMTQD